MTYACGSGIALRSQTRRDTLRLLRCIWPGSRRGITGTRGIGAGSDGGIDMRGLRVGAWQV